MQIDTEELVRIFDLTNVRQLLQEGRLHIAYFQPEAALPAALSMARDADQKARDADQKARDADQKARDADQKASEANKRVKELEEMFSQGEEFVNSVSVMSSCVSNCFV